MPALERAAILVAITCVLGSEDAVESVSLLQLDARRKQQKWARRRSDTVSSRDPWPWGRNPYTRCHEAKQSHRSRCEVLDSVTEPDAVSTKSAHYCARLAYDAGATGFNFLPGKKCEVLQCHTASMLFTLAEDGDEAWQVHSQTCGLVHRGRYFGTRDCGIHHTSYHEYEAPPSEACSHMLRFEGSASGSVRSGLRYENVLDGADLLIEAMGDYQPGKDLLPQSHHEHGLISVRSGTKAMFQFRIVRSGTEEEVAIPWFGVTVAGITAQENCERPINVNATHFFSYHLTPDSEIAVKATPPSGVTPPSALFRGVTFPEDSFTSSAMNHAQERRGVTLVYRDTSRFRLRVDVGPGAAGRQLKLGGPALVHCSDQPKGERGVLFAKGNNLTVIDNVAGSLMLDADHRNDQLQAETNEVLAKEAAAVLHNAVEDASDRSYEWMEQVVQNSTEAMENEEPSPEELPVIESMASPQAETPAGIPVAEYKQADAQNDAEQAEQSEMSTVIIANTAAPSVLSSEEAEKVTIDVEDLTREIGEIGDEDLVSIAQAEDQGVEVRWPVDRPGLVDRFTALALHGRITHQQLLSVLHALEKQKAKNNTADEQSADNSKTADEVTVAAKDTHEDAESNLEEGGDSEKKDSEKHTEKRHSEKHKEKRDSERHKEQRDSEKHEDDHKKAKSEEPHQVPGTNVESLHIGEDKEASESADAMSEEGFVSAIESFLDNKSIGQTLSLLATSVM